MTNVWAALVVLGVLIFVHELGHFVAARICGVTVTAFSLGFGPRLLHYKKGDTDYRLSIIPLGGYCKMLGEVPGEDADEEGEAAGIENPVSFAEQSVWRRLFIVAAGPVSNFILAAIIFALILMSWGTPVLSPQVGELLEGYPAAASGLKSGDLVTEVNGQAVTTWKQMAKAIQNNGLEPLHLTIRRDDALTRITITPAVGESKDIFGQQVKKPMIGISASGQSFTRRLGFFGALVGGVEQTWEIAELTYMTIVKLIQRQIPVSSVGGPLFIAKAAGDQARAGLVNLLFFMGLISVNLGILNILPIPVLDGGHLLFFLIEAVIRRPVSEKIRLRAQQVGMVFLMLFMAVVFYHDIIRLLGGGSTG